MFGLMIELSDRDQRRILSLHGSIAIYISAYRFKMMGAYGGSFKAKVKNIAM